LLISKFELQQIIKEELIKVLLASKEEDLQAFVEGTISEAEFLKRLGRKVMPWAVAGAIGAGSLLGPQATYAKPPETPTTQAPAETNMKVFLQKHPLAAQERLKTLLSRLVRLKAPQAIKQLKETYLSQVQKQSFVRFIKSMKGFEKETEESILKNYEAYRKAAENALNSVSIVMFHEAIDQVPIDYIKRNVPAFFDVDQKKIFVNPFAYYYTGGFEYAGLNQNLKEEYIHAVQSFIKKQLKMPIAHMQTKAASNLFLPREQTGLSQKDYDYLTTPVEFHAKMFKLKSDLAKKDPSNFDSSGRLKKEVLLQLMKMPVKDLGPHRVLKVLDPNKIDKVLEFFNMIVKAKTQKTSQMA